MLCYRNEKVPRFPYQTHRAYVCALRVCICWPFSTLTSITTINLSHRNSFLIVFKTMTKFLLKSATFRGANCEKHSPGKESKPSEITKAHCLYNHLGRRKLICMTNRPSPCSHTIACISVKWIYIAEGLLILFEKASISKEFRWEIRCGGLVEKSPDSCCQKFFFVSSTKPWHRGYVGASYVCVACVRVACLRRVCVLRVCVLRVCVNISSSQPKRTFYFSGKSPFLMFLSTLRAHVRACVVCLRGYSATLCVQARVSN